MVSAKKLVFAASLLLSGVVAVPFPAMERSISAAEVRATKDFAIESGGSNSIEVLNTAVKEKRAKSAGVSKAHGAATTPSAPKATSKSHGAVPSLSVVKGASKAHQSSPTPIPAKTSSKSRGAATTPNTPKGTSKSHGAVPSLSVVKGASKSHKSSPTPNVPKTSSKAHGFVPSSSVVKGASKAHQSSPTSIPAKTSSKPHGASTTLTATSAIKACRTNTSKSLQRRVRPIAQTEDVNNIHEDRYADKGQIAANRGKASIVDLSGCTALFFYTLDKGQPDTLVYAQHITCGKEDQDVPAAADRAGAGLGVYIKTMSKMRYNRVAALLTPHATILGSWETTGEYSLSCDDKRVTVTASSGGFFKEFETDLVDPEPQSK